MMPTVGTSPTPKATTASGPCPTSWLAGSYSPDRETRIEQLEDALYDIADFAMTEDREWILNTANSALDGSRTFSRIKKLEQQVRDLKEDLRLEALARQSAAEAGANAYAQLHELEQNMRMS